MHFFRFIFVFPELFARFARRRTFEHHEVSILDTFASGSPEGTGGILVGAFCHFLFRQVQAFHVDSGFFKEFQDRSLVEEMLVNLLHLGRVNHLFDTKGGSQVIVDIIHGSRFGCVEVNGHSRNDGGLRGIVQEDILGFRLVFGTSAGGNTSHHVDRCLVRLGLGRRSLKGLGAGNQSCAGQNEIGYFHCQNANGSIVKFGRSGCLFRVGTSL